MDLGSTSGPLATEASIPIYQWRSCAMANFWRYFFVHFTYSIKYWDITITANMISLRHAHEMSAPTVVVHGRVSGELKK